MATPKFNSKSPTIRRILREAHEISTSPSADYTAAPLESDLFEWHFTLRGPPDSVYAGGVYHGRIVLPPAYPLSPPSFRFATPSGRFEANREICLSISGHHEETWQPAWGVRTALVALRSFMETEARGQLGGLETTDAVRRALAAESPSFRCPVCARSNAEIIADAAAAAAAAAAADASAAAVDVPVPPELDMRWRDEMAPASTRDGPGHDGDPETAALAEGFVPTTAPAAQQPPPPTRTVPLPPPPPASSPRAHAQPPLAQPQAQLHRRSDDGVPLWVDRAIIVVGVLLLAMFLKVLVS